MKKPCQWLAAAVMAVACTGAPAANIIINNSDSPGVGFNDNTPATPAGGNPGTTVGEQRLIAFEFAAALWGEMLVSNVDIHVDASFGPLNCDASGGVLGGASPLALEADFAGAPQADTWYFSALANALAGVDLNPADDDIRATFNGAIDNNDNCLQGSNWYYGLDNAPPGSDIDFLNVVMHELAHGLGSASAINVIFGSFPGGTPDAYGRLAFDNSTLLHFDEMSNTQRRNALTNDGAIVWDGALVTSIVADILGPLPTLEVTSPPLGNVQIQTASFGPAIPLTGLAGTIVLADDGTGNANDICEPLTAASAAAVAGNIALLDRGDCTFTSKVAFAQAAGAVAVLVANNEASGLPPMGGQDSSISIPSVGISMADGDAIKALLPGVVGLLGVDETRLAGADDVGRVRLYAPTQLASGSSFSHWDSVASPNLLMEPSITSTLRSAVNVDLTAALFADIGWGIVDGDDDLVPDTNDNCTTIANTPQFDTNADGYGNHCDADLNGDLAVNFLDLGTMKAVFFTDNADADLNVDGVVNFLDLGQMKALFFAAPGPSGVAP